MRQHTEDPDILLRFQGYRLDRAQEYFLAKHMQLWGGWVRLPEGLTWDGLAARLSQRWGHTVWWPGWWDAAWDRKVDADRVWGATRLSQRLAPRGTADGTQAQQEPAAASRNGTPKRRAPSRNGTSHNGTPSPRAGAVADLFAQQNP